jgi:hypothetical protein
MMRSGRGALVYRLAWQKHRICVSGFHPGKRAGVGLPAAYDAPLVSEQYNKLPSEQS